MDPTFVVPISGVDFVRYVAFYSLLARTPLRPRLIIAASGGCMVSYMALMSSFTQAIESWRINSSMFAYKTIPVMPRMLTYLLTGSLYRRPNIDAFIADSFVPSKLTDVEIVTGYYGLTAGRVTLSSNMAKADSLLNKDHFVLADVNVEYTDGKLEPTLLAIEATTNIPFLLPAMGKGQLIDYGVHSPSPLTFMRTGSQLPSGLLRKVVYMAPIDVESTSADGMRELMFVNDVLTEISRLASGYDSYETFTVDMRKPLADQLTFLNKLFTLNRYLLVMYTPVNIGLSIADFVWQQAKDAVDLVKTNIRFRLYS